MILHVEIAATDLDRAIAFYRDVFGVGFAEPIALHESRMAHAEGPFEGASWSLCQGEVYVPTHNGAILYFSVDDIDGVLDRAKQLGSALLFSKTLLANGSHVAEISDSEGNRIALQTRA